MNFCSNCGSKNEVQGKFCANCGQATNATSEVKTQSFDPTTPENQSAILAEFWMRYRDDEEYSELLSYGDIAFPLAYAIKNNIVASTPEAQEFIDEVFKLLLEHLGLEDTNFEDLEELGLVSESD